MKAFRFPLDRALHIRRAQLEVEQSKLQKLNHDREQVELQTSVVLKEAADIRRAITNQVVWMENEVSTVPDYQRATKQNLIKLDQKRHALMKQILEQRQLTVDAERKVKLLEQLRGKRFAEWDQALQRELEAFASDAYLARWSQSH